MSVEQLLCPPSLEELEKIHKSIGYNEERFRNKLRQLNAWLATRPHLPQVTDANMLASYLVRFKLDVEKTKRRLELYYAYKTKTNVLSVRPFQGRELDAADYISIVPLPRLTPDGYRVVFHATKGGDVDLLDLGVAYRKCVKADLLLTCKDPIKAGLILVFDCRHFEPAHVQKILVPKLRTYLTVGQEVLLGRIKQVHLINAPVYMEKIVNVVRSFLKEKLRKRIIVHQDSSLVDHMPKYCVPEDYGGTERPLSDLERDWQLFLRTMEPWFAEWEKAKLLGPIPADCKVDFDDDDITCGVEGSFRQLNID